MYIILTCNPINFELEIDNWYKKFDESHPNHIIKKWKIIKIIENKHCNEVSHYIKYKIKWCN